MRDGNSNEEGDGKGNKGGGQTTVMAMKRAMAMASRVAGDKEGNDNSGKSDGDGIEGGGQATATRAMATRVASKQRHQRQWQRQWHLQLCGQWGWQ